MLNIVRNEGTGQLKTNLLFLVCVFETEAKLKHNKTPQLQEELKKLRCFPEQKLSQHLLFGGDN